MISFQNITKVYGDGDTALDGVSFDIDEGEFVSLVGKSGAGKTTLLRFLLREDTPTKGRVLFQGRNVADIRENELPELRRKIGVVFQDYKLLPQKTAYENIAYVMEMMGGEEADIERDVLEVLEIVGLVERADHLPIQLSGGEQQRVALARAFATDAPILLMDEPFSALDPLIRNRLQDELLDLQEKLNKTILFVSHDLDEAMKLGNSIAIMEGGYVVQHGTPEDIALRPANEYVADFVAHMNPVNILRGRAIMHRIDRDQRNTTGELSVEDEDIRITLQGGIIRAANSGEHGELKLIQYDGNLPDDLDGTDNSVIFVADDTVLLKDLIEMRSITQNPVLLTREGRISGTLGRKEFFESLTQTATVAD